MPRLKLSDRVAAFEGSLKGFSKLSKEIRSHSGEAVFNYYMKPVAEVMHKRCELVRELCSHEISKLLEVEALELLNAPPEERAKRIQFLSENPAVYLRSLSARIIRTLEQMDVAKKLPEEVKKRL